MLQPVDLLHHANPLQVRAFGCQPFADQATPEEGNRKRNRYQTLSSDFSDWHPAGPPQPRFEQSDCQEFQTLKTSG
jgi:hypothetical protein